MGNSTEIIINEAGYYKVSTVDDWFLMETPQAVLAIWLAYVAFVLKLGPDFMAQRPAYQLKNTLVVYNIFQIALSFYIFCLGTGFLYTWGLAPSSCIIERKDMQPEILRGFYIYFLAKLSELFDTVFFVLRKKMKQVTFLHVYHHSLMLLTSWLALKYNPTDTVVFLGTLNSLVHVLMYGYYGLAAFPSLAKYLWWKKYITALQLVQFGLIFLQVSASSFVSSCRTSYILLIAILFNTGLMVYLFREFYVKAYTKKILSACRSGTEDPQLLDYPSPGKNIIQRRSTRRG